MQNLVQFFSEFSFLDVFSITIMLFTVVDVLGSTPIVAALNDRGRPVSPVRATVISGAIMVAFYYGGQALLHIFNVEIAAFAVGGGMLLFFMALELLLDITIFQDAPDIKDATIVPMVFPLLAGPAVLTMLLSLKSQYADINIMIGLALNIGWIFFVLTAVDRLQKYLTPKVLFIMRKFFGIILLAISIEMFLSNLLKCIGKG